jgi:hypothetical protein
MHRPIVMCATMTDNIKRFTSCDTNGMRIGWLSKLMGYFVFLS